MNRPVIWRIDHLVEPPRTDLRHVGIEDRPWPRRATILRTGIAVHTHQEALYDVRVQLPCLVTP